MSYDQSSLLSLISHIHSQSQEFLQKEMKGTGLSELATSHGNILFCLNQAGQMTQGELSKKINRDKSTTTALVRRLEKEGLVELTKDSKDSRCKIVRLTEEGKKFNEKTAGLSKKLMETAWQGFSENDQQQLVSLLNRLSENLQ